ncbi:MAG: hypothetical protein R3C27_02180 [Hyphomonadaceae bacterium]
MLTGRAGAKVRTAPRRNAAVIVRVATATGSRQPADPSGDHWWLRVTLADGRTGYVREDTVTTESRAAALAT